MTGEYKQKPLLDLTQREYMKTISLIMHWRLWNCW